jgi:hypothetical protein
MASSSCIETGTSARTDVPATTGSPRESSHSRKAPATTFSSTSLTVPPCAFRIFLTSSRSARATATRR